MVNIEEKLLELLNGVPPPEKICTKCKTLKPICEFTGRLTAPYAMSACRVCERKRGLSYYHTDGYKIRKSVYNKKRWRAPGFAENQSILKKEKRIHRVLEARAENNARNLECKKRAMDYKGNKCCCCGYNATTAALDFHHIDPKTKSGNTSAIIKKSWNEAKDELDKCALVCANCHREIHSGFRKCPDLEIIKDQPCVEIWD